MAIIDFETATREIATSLVDTNSRGVASPFFFLVGAGLSVPTIPMSSEMTKILSERFNGDRKNLQPPSDPQDAYSFWFELTMPSAVERARFLREMVEGKSVSPGAFSLSKALCWEVNNRPLFNLALTTNFDDFVERGVKFLGAKHYVHAHPIALDRVDFTETSERQIIHLHGSYKFYNCKNTASEIDATNSDGSFESDIVDDFFSRLMPETMPIVIGYAGWSKDVFMKHLVRLSRRQHLPRNGYWFCHEADAIDALPSGVVDHSNLRFVVDKEVQIEAVRALEGIMGELPASTFKSSGGMFSAAVAEINGQSALDTEIKQGGQSLSDLEESEKEVEAIMLGEKWVEPMLLLQNDRVRAAWNILVCGDLKPKSTAEVLTFFGVIAGAAKRLYYDRNIVEKAKSLANEIKETVEFGSKTIDEARAAILALDEKDFEEPIMTQECENCGKLLPTGAKAFLERTLLHLACIDCGTLYVIRPKSYSCSVVEKGHEVSYIRSNS